MSLEQPISCILINPQQKSIQTKTWTGSYSEIDDLLESNDYFTEHGSIILFNKLVEYVITYGGVHQESNRGWRIREDGFDKDARFDKHSNWSNILLMSPMNDSYYYHVSCPITAQQLVQRLDWTSHNADFSEITYSPAINADIIV